MFSQNWGKMPSKFQTLWALWQRVAQGWRLHLRQKVPHDCLNVCGNVFSNCLCGTCPASASLMLPTSASVFQRLLVFSSCLSFVFHNCHYFWFSKKKLCMLYGKWTECLYTVDPASFEAHKTNDKKATEEKMNKSVCCIKKNTSTLFWNLCFGLCCVFFNICFMDFTSWWFNLIDLLLYSCLYCDTDSCNKYIWLY